MQENNWIFCNATESSVFYKFLRDLLAKLTVAEILDKTLV
ncbi:hypothetical protein N499_1346 [Wolbachia pipientis wVitA]|nr:hypothetical protein N499_1346 [Wolbachia pipientis wVitA]